MLEKIRSKWDTVLQVMKEEYDIIDVVFETWLLPLEVVDVRDTVVFVMVPETYFISYLHKRFTVKLQVSIEVVTGFKCTVQFVSPDDKAAMPSSAAKKDSSPYASTQNVNLNPKYTFNTFVVGSNNRMAHAACLAVAESPAEVYNPLFIYGGVGLGKTHLMHSIANFILKNDPSSRVMYVTSEKFTNELIDSIRNKTTPDFREKYRNNDILLIDDIQFIQGKESTIEEFFHTFNTLHESKKQIIISSDRSPKDLVNLEDRLVSRFEWGLTVDIQAPDYETRMAILRKKEELEGYNIDNEVIKYIATNIKSNIRDLEGAFNKIVAAGKLNKVDVTLDLAEEALKDIIYPDKSKVVTPSLIIDIVSEHFGVKPEDITSKKRNSEYVLPRQIVMYLCRELTATPYADIGKLLSKKDHTTIMHGVKKITAEMEVNEDIKNKVDIIIKKINPS